MKRAQLGSISHGTLRSEDLIPAFISELRALRGALPKSLHRAIQLDESDDDRSEIVNDLIDALNNYAPDYAYFGTHPGDGSDFGFWLSEDWQQQAKDDDVPMVSDLGELPKGYAGLACQISDHGNAALYVVTKSGKAREIWGVV